MRDQADQAPAQPAPPAPPQPGQFVFSGQQIATSPRAAYQALRDKREVLGDQMNRLLNRRDNIAERLHSPNLAGTEKTALEQHMREITTRIVDMEKQLHAADAEVSAAAGVPGAASTSIARGPSRSGPPEEAIGLAVGLAGLALVIVAIGYARRMWKGASTAITQLPASFEQRFSRLEDSIDAVAIEIERVSEGQRFLSRVYGEQSARTVGGAPAQPVEVPSKIAEPVRRG